jgi:ribosomal subunit interface protein
MKIDIVTHNFTMSPAIKKYVQKKFDKLDKFREDFRLKLTITKEPHNFVVKVILEGGKEFYQATESRYLNIYKSINKVYSKVKKPIRRARKGFWAKLLRKK